MGDVENYELKPLPGEEPVRVNRGPSAKSTRSFEAARAVLETLLGPILIMDGNQKISYLNAAARKLLVNGLDKRLETHLRTRPDKAAFSQVRFKLANGRDLVLKIHLTSIDWIGQRATQVSIADVTPYLAAVTQLQNKLAMHRRTLERLRTQQADDVKAAAARTGPSVQTGVSGAEAVQNLQTQLNEQSGRLAEAEKETERLKQELHQASEGNAQLRKDLATLVRVREELKGSRQRVQEQLRELQAELASGVERQGDDDRRASEERIRALDDALAKAKADLEAESRKAREAHEVREAEQSQLLAKVSELTSLREELEKKVAALAAEATAAREQIGAAVGGREAQGRECARLSARLVEQAKEFDAQAAELVRLQELTRSQAEELAKVRESVARQTQTAADDREKLAQEAERLRAELASAVVKKDELAREVEILRLAGAEARRQLEEASSRRQALEKEQTALQRNIAGLEQSRAEAEKARDTHERETRRELQAGKERCGRLAEEVKALCAELGVARGKQEESAREADTLRLAAAESRKQLEEESSQRQALERERATLQQDIESLERTRAASEKAREAVEQEARAQADALAHAREEIEALSAKRETAEQERECAVQRAQEEAGLRIRAEEQNAKLRAHFQTAQRAAKEQHDHAAETRQRAELLSQELKNARSELTCQAEAAQKRQNEWARERADLEFRAQLAAKALNDATDKLKQSDVARQRAEQELERLRADLRVAAERSAAERNSARPTGAEPDAQRGPVTADKAESGGVNFEEQLAERTRELAEVKQQLEATTAQVLPAQASCQSRAQEVLELRCLASTLGKKYATLEKHIKARTREQMRLILELDRQIGRRRDAEAENERFRREMSPERGTSPVEADAVEPATHGVMDINSIARRRREFLPGNQSAAGAAAKAVAAL